MNSRPNSFDLTSLVRLFYDAPERLGTLVPVAAQDLPAVPRQLLAHEHHMTVTVEAFHRSPVDVKVLQVARTPDRYARKILLTRQSDGRVVQFGLMRIDLSVLAPAVREQIEGEHIPLGRVLIQNNVLREIRLLQLWKVTPGDDLRQLFSLSDDQPTYGRTAWIDCNGQPAVELLEIVAPAE